MVRKRKLNLTKQSSVSIGLQETVIDLSKKNVQCAEKKNANNINCANICHKKSHGSNNWQTFKEVLKYTELKGPKPPNIKTNYRNKSVKIIPKEVIEPSKTDFQTKSGGTPLQLVVLKKPVVNFKSSEDKFKPVIKEKKHLVQCESQAEKKILTKHIAMDCEMVGVEIGVNNNMLARISLVNSHGDCVYDKFVKPTEKVLDYRTHVSGVRPEDLENAEDFNTVQKEVAEILKGRVLIGHGLKHDLSVLFLSHPKQAIRDTSKFKKFRQGRTPSLKKLAMKYLGVSIQEGEHSSVQDALAAMQLYRMFKKEWEGNLKNPHVFKYKKGTKKSNPKTDT